MLERLERILDDSKVDEETLRRLNEAYRDSALVDIYYIIMGFYHSVKAYVKEKWDSKYARSRE